MSAFDPKRTLGVDTDGRGKPNRTFMKSRLFAASFGGRRLGAVLCRLIA